MNSHTTVKAIIHSKGQKKQGNIHNLTDNGVHSRGKLLPRQRHTPLQGTNMQPNGDPIETILWGDM